MVLVDENQQLTPRESMLMEHDTEEARLAREHAVRMKQLEVELAKANHSATIELRKLEARWSSWLKLPALIIKLPVLVLLSFGYLLDSLRGSEPSKDFWKLFS